MKIGSFLKDKWLTTTLLLVAIASIEVILLLYPFGEFIKIYIPVVIVGLYAIGLAIEYIVKRNFYQNVMDTLEELEDKYLITEIIQFPDFTEGEILKRVLEEIDKSMLEHVNEYKYRGEDYKDYIELWIHEIKLPIAASKMIIENNKSNTTKRIEEELDKVENYIEQALFYARSNTVEKDYFIKKVALKEMVNESIKKNRSALIQEKIAIYIHDIEMDVRTDSKWVVFILNQVIQNSVKYKSQDRNSQIEIYADKEKEKVILWIKDNGMGIKKGEITRVFEKGFTGTNGRLLSKKSTGIGLYLCKKLCDKLGIAIGLNSVQGEGTEICLVFPQSSWGSFEE